MRVFIASYATMGDVEATLDDKPSDYIELDQMAAPQFVSIHASNDPAPDGRWLINLMTALRNEVVEDETATADELTWVEPKHEAPDPGRETWTYDILYWDRSVAARLVIQAVETV